MFPEALKEAVKEASPNSTNRPADPPAPMTWLAAALEGFSPTAEMPEITEAEELLAAVAQWSARNGSARR
jgi:hypothetical protein